jgi:penicillin V acylase-like amidase (Ntn superfamily)
MDADVRHRFLRAALFSQCALPFPGARQGVQRVLSILNIFDIPLGYKSYAHADSKIYPQCTQWTSVTDLRDRRIHFRTFFNPDLQMIGLGGLDLSGGEIRFIPLGTGFSARAVSVPQGRRPECPGGTRSGICLASFSASGSPPGCGMRPEPRSGQAAS